MDDGNLLVTAPNTALSVNCQNTLNKLEAWSSKSKLKVNCDKTSVMAIICKNDELTPAMSGSNICETKTNHKIVGLVVEKHLNFKSHMDVLEGKIYRKKREAEKLHSGQLGIILQITHLIV